MAEADRWYIELIEGFFSFLVLPAKRGWCYSEGCRGSNSAEEEKSCGLDAAAEEQRKGK